jgi:leucyl-tRNA synthetase
VRGQIEVAANAGEPDVRAAAEAAENVAKHLEGKTIRKFVFVPKRLVNFVVGT